MNFPKFYDIVDKHVASREGSPQPVAFEFLREQVTKDQSLVANLDVWGIHYEIPISDARFTLFDERESQHEEPVYMAEISFCSSLESDPPYLRFALTKELMHVFDPMDTWINTRDKFIGFLKDLQNSPLEMTNGPIRVEHKAKWMALLVLIPLSLREYISDSVSVKGISKNEMAQELGLPRSLIDTALDEYYLTALQQLTK
jgi:hypothetical protein